MTMSEGVGIKPSKKFANGSIHENGTGKFEILDRYLDNNVIMLKYKWLTGEFEGQEETNKEVNINASIWKFQKVRGLTPSEREKSDVLETARDIHEEVEEVRQIVEMIRDFQQENLSDYMEHMVKIHDKVHAQATTILALTQKLEVAMTEIHELNRKMVLAEKLIDKMPTA
jgi:predicted RNase H-like nuclease (RuvC/YqgF family)